MKIRILQITVQMLIMGFAIAGTIAGVEPAYNLLIGATIVILVVSVFRYIAVTQNADATSPEEYRAMVKQRWPRPYLYSYYIVMISMLVAAGHGVLAVIWCIIWLATALTIVQADNKLAELEADELKEQPKEGE